MRLGHNDQQSHVRPSKLNKQIEYSLTIDIDCLITATWQACELWAREQHIKDFEQKETDT